MRWILVVCLAACAGSKGAGDGCPSSFDGSTGDSLEGEACAVDPVKTCFVIDEFSPCASAWWQCVGGKFHEVQGLDPTDGASCASSPISSCTFEGTFECDVEPTAQDCLCEPDGTWHCLCGCYGGTSDCPACPAAYDAGLDGRACGDEGNTCTWPGHTCTCTGGTLRCT